VTDVIPPTGAPPTEGPAIAPAAPRRRWRRPVFIAAFLAFAGIWAWGFWYDANRPKPEPLDAASVQAATAACGSALASLSALPQLPSGSTPTLVERTTLVRREDAIFTDLVTRLDAVRPLNHDGAKALTLFAADWQHLTQARERYVTALLAGQHDPQLILPVDPSAKPITIRMKDYAEIHSLTDCRPDDLQGEIVEGPRTYPRVP
jgi:hypothetical protein